MDNNNYHEGRHLAVTDRCHGTWRAFPIPGRSDEFNRGYAEAERIPWPLQTAPVAMRRAPRLRTKRRKVASTKSSFYPPLRSDPTPKWPDHQTAGWWHGGE